MDYAMRATTEDILLAGEGEEPAGQCEEAAVSPPDKEANSNRKRQHKKYRCKYEGCEKWAIAQGLCIGHGGRRKPCDHEGCTNNAVAQGVCKRHGAVVKQQHRYRCKYEECERWAVSQGLCVDHGGKRKPSKRKCCAHEGCEKWAISRGLCIGHGGKQKRKCCTHEGCEKYAVSQGLCAGHGGRRPKARKTCSHEGCDKVSVQGGVCWGHGAKDSQVCKHEGCSNAIVKGSVCKRHGANKMIEKCSLEGCPNQAVAQGLCIRHGARVNRRTPRKTYTCKHDNCEKWAVAQGLCIGHGGRRASHKRRRVESQETSRLRDDDRTVRAAIEDMPPGGEAFRDEDAVVVADSEDAEIGEGRALQQEEQGLEGSTLEEVDAFVGDVFEDVLENDEGANAAYEDDDDLRMHEKPRVRRSRMDSLDGDGDNAARAAVEDMLADDGKDATQDEGADEADDKLLKDDTGSRKQGRKRKPCAHEGCSELAQSEGVCWEHGAEFRAGKKSCDVDGCSRWPQANGRCWGHGGYNYRPKECKAEGCTNVAKGGAGVCRKHGAPPAKRKPCNVAGCTSLAKGKCGVCTRHGAPPSKLCSRDGCTSQAQLKGLCQKHGDKREGKKKQVAKKTCSHEGCTNLVQSNGVCKRHGAPKKTCSHEGCEKASIREGVCWGHGAKFQSVCRHEGCTNAIQMGGVCKRHGANALLKPRIKTKVQGLRVGRGAKVDRKTSQKRQVCKHEGCPKWTLRGGFCGEHSGTSRPKKDCRVEGCTTPVYSRGLCWKHGGGSRVVCGYEDCTNAIAYSGLCRRHATTAQHRTNECSVAGSADNELAQGTPDSQGVIDDVQLSGETCACEGCDYYVMEGQNFCFFHTKFPPSLPLNNDSPQSVTEGAPGTDMPSTDEGCSEDDAVEESNKLVGDSVLEVCQPVAEGGTREQSPNQPEALDDSAESTLADNADVDEISVTEIPADEDVGRGDEGLDNSADGCLTTVNMKGCLKKMLDAITESEKSLAAINSWDRSHGLRKCHSRTVVKTRRSRAKLKVFLTAAGEEAARADRLETNEVHAENDVDGDGRTLDGESVSGVRQPVEEGGIEQSPNQPDILDHSAKSTLAGNAEAPEFSATETAVEGDVGSGDGLAVNDADGDCQTLVGTEERARKQRPNKPKTFGDSTQATLFSGNAHAAKLAVAETADGDAGSGSEDLDAADEGSSELEHEEFQYPWRGEEEFEQPDIVFSQQYAQVQLEKNRCLQALDCLTRQSLQQQQEFMVGCMQGRYMQQFAQENRNSHSFHNAWVPSDMPNSHRYQKMRVLGDTEDDDDRSLQTLQDQAARLEDTCRQLAGAIRDNRSKRNGLQFAVHQLTEEAMLCESALQQVRRRIELLTCKQHGSSVPKHDEGHEPNEQEHTESRTLEPDIPGVPLRPFWFLEHLGPAEATAFEAILKQDSESIITSTVPVLDSSKLADDDVLFGRGGRVASTAGNRRFRALVKDFQPAYIECDNLITGSANREKARIAHSVVLIIRGRGGRFLRQKEDGVLYEVGDAQAQKKVGQALRERPCTKSKSFHKSGDSQQVLADNVVSYAPAHDAAPAKKRSALRPFWFLEHLDPAQATSFEAILKQDSEPVIPSIMPVSDSSKLADDDVLFGRGGGVASTAGNRRFRALVKDFQPAYIECDNFIAGAKREKTHIAHSIVIIIRQRGGRFLRRKEDELLYEVGDAQAQKKVGQALREGLCIRRDLIGKQTHIIA